MANPTRSYMAFLLRLWQTQNGEDGWRACLQDVHTGERKGFTSIDDLFIFLREKIDAAGVARDKQKPSQKE